MMAVKPDYPPGTKPRAAKPKVSKLPKGLLADFVRKHYAAPVQQGAFAKFRGNKNLVPIQDAAGTIRLTTPGQRAQRPDIFLGDPTVQGGYRNPNPALNPNDWETAQNRVGITYARPRTEFTGLDPQDAADLKSFDRLTEAQAGRIQGAYDQYATQSAADRDRATQALGDLARLAGSGFSAPQGWGLSSAETVLPAIQAENATAQSFGRSATTLADMNSLPTVARSEGLGAMENFRATRLGQRQDALETIRKNQADAQQAALEAELKRQDLAAQLRGQNLNLLGAFAGNQTDLAQSLLSSQTDLAQSGLQAQIDMGKLALDQQQLSGQAIGDQFRNPRQLRTGGFSMGPWVTKPKNVKGVTFEQSTDGNWYGKPGKTSAGAGKPLTVGEQSARNKAIADLAGIARNGITDDKGNVTRLSATEAAELAASEYGVTRAWAYDQARLAGFHHRKGEWQPPKWKKTSDPKRRTPWKPPPGLAGVTSG
jgi:hypothetical protein